MIRRRSAIGPAGLFALLLCAALAACGGGGAPAPATPTPAPVTPTPTPPASNDAAISVLMFGNSHTAFHDLPGMLQAMLRAGRPGKTVAVVREPAILHLDARLDHPASIRLLESQRWSAVVLQAQNYSSSGNFTYSTTEAVELARRARVQGAVPIMFPEWARRGINESQRIYDLHVSIAERQAACVAPIPQAFVLAQGRYPGLELLDGDGNHSAPDGAFLAALVLYATMTGNAPTDLPALAGFGVADATQERLRGVAADQVRTVSSRQYCPNDVFL